MGDEEGFGKAEDAGEDEGVTTGNVHLGKERSWEKIEKNRKDRKGRQEQGGERGGEGS